MNKEIIEQRMIKEVSPNDLAFMLKYILAGKSTFTIQSTKYTPAKHYTYKFIKSTAKKALDSPVKSHCYKVYYLYGPDNTKNFKFFALFYSDSYTLIFNPKGGQLSISTHGPRKFLESFFNLLLLGLNTEHLTMKSTLPSTCHFYTTNRCAACGRLLTTPESVELGYGPHCYARRLSEGKGGDI